MFFRRLEPLIALSVVGCAIAPAAPARVGLHYQRIVLSPEAVEQPLLQGPPQTAGLRSGRVVLKPGEHMHRHSTGAHEELLVFLQGRAQVLVGSETLEVAAGQVLYIPPQTDHELHNEGPDELRYIYTVAPVSP